MAWKSILVALTQAFDVEALDLLGFLAHPQTQNFLCDGTGVLRFARLIAAGLVTYELAAANGPLRTYRVAFAPKGLLLFEAWKAGDRKALEVALVPPDPGDA